MLPVFQFLLAFVEILIQGKHIILKFYNHEIIIVQKQPKRDEPNNQHFRCFFWLHRQYLFSRCFRSSGTWPADFWVFQIQMWSFSIIEKSFLREGFLLVISKKISHRLNPGKFIDRYTEQARVIQAILPVLLCWFRPCLNPWQLNDGAPKFNRRARCQHKSSGPMFVKWSISLKILPILITAKLLTYKIQTYAITK